MMPKIKLAILGSLVLVLSAFTNNEPPEVFVKLLNRSKMSFDQVPGFTSTEIIENRQMNYEYAVLNESKDFEARFAIRPLDELIREYNENKKNGTQGVAVHPNKYYEAVFQATVLNISGGQLPTPTFFGKEAVKNEFNADWGATVFVEVGEEFGQKYKYCLVVAIHKDDLGDAYYFYLSGKKENIMSNAQLLFHSLKFK